MSNAGEEGTLIHKFIGGPNILFLSGADWKRHRKVGRDAILYDLTLLLTDCQLGLSTIDACPIIWRSCEKDASIDGKDRGGCDRCQRLVSTVHVGRDWMWRIW